MEQYIAGGVGGFTGVASSYWLDTLRINYQEGKYKTIRDCFRHICKSDGLRSLYRGASVNIIGISGEKSVVFGTYNFVKQMQYITNSYTNIFFAGICAGIASLPIVTPVEKIKLAMQSNQLHALGKSNTLQEIIRSTKLNTLYTGWTATLYREVPGYGIYFTTYEYLKSKTRDNIPTQPQAFGIGCCSGFASWIFIYPADPIKTIMQNSKELFGDKYNMYSAIRHIYSTHGFGGFYRGFSLGLFRSMPLHGGAICGYELTLKINKKFANY